MRPSPRDFLTNLVLKSNHTIRLDSELVNRKGGGWIIYLTAMTSESIQLLSMLTSSNPEFVFRLIRQKMPRKQEELPTGEKLKRFEDIEITIDKGDATDNEVADILAEISIIYRMTGGSGINFELAEMLQLEIEPV